MKQRIKNTYGFKEEDIEIITLDNMKLSRQKNLIDVIGNNIKDSRQNRLPASYFSYLYGNVNETLSIIDKYKINIVMVNNFTNYLKDDMNDNSLPLLDKNFPYYFKRFHSVCNPKSSLELETLCLALDYLNKFYEFKKNNEEINTFEIASNDVFISYNNDTIPFCCIATKKIDAFRMDDYFSSFIKKNAINIKDPTFLLPFKNRFFDKLKSTFQLLLKKNYFIGDLHYGNIFVNDTVDNNVKIYFADLEIPDLLPKQYNDNDFSFVSTKKADDFYKRWYLFVLFYYELMFLYIIDILYITDISDEFREELIDKYIDYKYYFGIPLIYSYAHGSLSKLEPIPTHFKKQFIDENDSIVTSLLSKEYEKKIEISKTYNIVLIVSLVLLIGLCVIFILYFMYNKNETNIKYEKIM